MAVNYELKAEVLSNGFYDLFREVSKSLWFGGVGKDVGQKMSFETAKQWQSILFDSNPNMCKECQRIINANGKRIRRLKKRISSLLTSECVFVTFTFRDSVLESTSEETRRQYVRRYLEQYDYVGNIDFGAKNDREHYHAVVQCSKLPCKEWVSKCGGVKVEKIRNNITSITKLSKYVSKLTNHAIKETTKRCHLIYSRGSKSA